MKNLQIIAYISALLLVFSCKNESSNTINNIPVNTQVTTPTLLTQNNNGVPIFHTCIEIEDTILSPITKFYTDSINYALQNQYVFVDDKQEVRVLKDPQSITTSEISTYFPYLMQIHIGPAFNGNVQKIDVSYTVNQTSFMHLNQRVQGAKPQGMTSDFGTTYWPSCAEDTPGCKVKFMVANLVTLAFR